MENKKNLSTGALVALIVIAALNIFWLICVFIEFKGSITFPIWVGIFEFAVAVFYAIYGYKKPHGNHMRYLLLIHAVIVAVLLLRLLDSANDPTYINALYLAEIILVVYMAGRLDRYKQNLVISAAVLVCNGICSGNLVNNIISSGSPLTLVSFVPCVGCVAAWLLIAASYIIRYKPHKEAGLAADKG